MTRIPTIKAALMRSLAALSSAALLAVVPQLSAQQPTQLTTADYARAERFLRNNVIPLVSGIGAQPSWLGGERFWYRSNRQGGADLVIIDPTRALRSVCNSETERCGAAIDANELQRA